MRRQTAPLRELYRPRLVPQGFVGAFPCCKEKPIWRQTDELAYATADLGGFLLAERRRRRERRVFVTTDGTDGDVISAGGGSAM
jgi:hypothetical protein